MTEKFMGVPFPDGYESLDYIEQCCWADGVRDTLKAYGLDQDQTETPDN